MRERERKRNNGKYKSVCLCVSKIFKNSMDDEATEAYK